MYIQPLENRGLASQVKVNPEVKGVIVKGANVLPTRVLEDFFRSQTGKPLNYPRMSAAVKGINAWYDDRGYIGQARHNPLALPPIPPFVHWACTTHVLSIVATSWHNPIVGNNLGIPPYLPTWHNLAISENTPAKPFQYKLSGICSIM